MGMLGHVTLDTLHQLRKAHLQHIPQCLLNYIDKCLCDICNSALTSPYLDITPELPDLDRNPASSSSFFFLSLLRVVFLSPTRTTLSLNISHVTIGCYTCFISICFLKTLCLCLLITFFLSRYSLYFIYHITSSVIPLYFLVQHLRVSSSFVSENLPNCDLL